MQIKRDFYLNQLIDRKHNGMIKIVSGIRRCGKSYLLSELFTGHLLDNGCAKDHIIHIDLDTRDDVKYRNPDTCNEYVKSCIKDDKIMGKKKSENKCKKIFFKTVKFKKSLLYTGKLFPLPKDVK